MATPKNKNAEHQNIFIVPNFYEKAKKLRGQFDSTFQDPKEPNQERFLWDYWHVPGQYTMLRTPAYNFFQEELYIPLHEKIMQWGQEYLGCNEISPTWMSCYIDGCQQEIHADIPHGPWAFVYSLTPWETRKFTGGETFLASEHLTDYWRTFQNRSTLESHHAFELIEPKFNQLTVFDPRIPHGVKTVRGTHDVSQGRLVIHGWFLNPRPIVKGPLSTKELYNCIEDLGQGIADSGIIQSGAFGMMSFRIQVSAKGQVEKVKLLINNLRLPLTTDLSHAHPMRTIEKSMISFMKKWRFSPRKTGSMVTLPIQFDAQIN